MTCCDCGKEFPKRGNSKRCRTCREAYLEACPITGHAVHKEDLMLMVECRGFYALIRKPRELKHRRCLRCAKDFRSYQYRTCENCRVANQRAGVMAI